MVRPREFDRDAALTSAMTLFRQKGFAATSTDDLLKAMGIGRQSMYNAFGDKWQLYLEVLQTYQQNMLGAHLTRLNGPAVPLDGIRDLLNGLVPSDDALRALGCLGVSAVGEFGTSEAELGQLAQKVSQALGARIAERIREGQTRGEIDASIEPGEGAAFIQTTMTGFQVAARAGAGVKDMRKLTDFVVGRLAAH